MTPESRDDLLASIEEESDRLARFVANLLDMTRIEAGTVDAKRDWVDVGDVIHGALQRAARYFPGRTIETSIGDGPATDPGRQRASGAGAVQPDRQCGQIWRAATRSASMPGPMTNDVVISVTDLGKGIPAKDLENIFEKFFRRGKPDGRTPGTGLGLAIARGFVEAMGGTIRAESPAVKRRGTRITLRFPAVLESENLPEERMSRERILVVDDEPQIQRFLRPALEAAGYDVVEALNGAEALKAAATAAPALVILDLGLPDMDGKDVIARLRGWSQVPIIILSARDQETEKIAALDLGADDYVEKPFGIGELTARMRTALRHRIQEAGGLTGISVDGLEIDTVRRVVERDGKALKLTPKEYDLLLLLARHAGRVVTHKTLLTSVWGPAHGEDMHYLRVFIGQLRGKIERDPADPKIIRTEPGVGYRFVTD